MKFCSINGCDNPHYSLGYCPKHCMRLKRHGDPLYKFNRECSLEDCNRKHSCKGLCHYHYTIKYRDPDKHRYNNRKWVRNHPEQVRECQRKNYIKNRKHLSERHRKYNKDHPEVTLKSQIKYLTKLGQIFDLNSNEYKHALLSWSKTIKKLDNNMCKNCDSTENLNTHHIIPKSFFPTLALDINNGVTLCRYCHGEIHGYKIYH